MYEPNKPHLNNLSYYEVYRYRVTKNGSNHQEREYNYGLKNFDKFLEEHPSAVTVKVDGLTERASIASNKQDQYKLTKEILTRITSKIHPGSIVEWADEHWIVFQKELQPNQTYISCFMIRCNEVVKWIDSYGVEHRQHAYVFSSKDSMVKMNFRTWNRLITPQPNQYLEMLVPTEPTIKLGQKFIIAERAWFVDEYDATSAPGVTYYSLTEDKIDRLDDDLENEIANYKDLGSYQIVMPTNIECGENQPLTVNPSVYNNGYLTEEPLKFVIKDTDIAEATYVNGTVTIIPKEVGETTMRVMLTNQPKVYKIVYIKVGEDNVVNCVLIGSDNIKTTQSARYEVHELSNTDNIIPITSFEISDETLATGEIEDGILIIYANDRNILNRFTLTVHAGDNTFTKEIAIRSLW